MPPLDPTPISAPDLTGPVSFVNWPIVAAGRGRRRAARPFAFVHLDLDLRHEHIAATTIPLLGGLEGLFRERSVVEHDDLLRLSALALHAFAERGFKRVDHWEVEPGGWLPLPEATHASLAEPVGHLLKALNSEAWKPFAEARTFSVRLSGPSRMRADLEVHRVHRERGHSISTDLRGTISPRDLEGVVRALRLRLPVLRVTVGSFEHRDAKA